MKIQQIQHIKKRGLEQGKTLRSKQKVTDVTKKRKKSRNLAGQKTAFQMQEQGKAINLLIGKNLNKG